MNYAGIRGWGKCLPSSILTNDDLASVLDTSDEWIVSRTGIKERRISAHPVSEMAAMAAQNALDCAGMTISDIDLLILCTATPDTLVPSAASQTLVKLSAERVACFDMNAACGGFVYGLHLARGLIASDLHKNILVVGAERLSWFQNWSSRSTSVLFGDGAGALVLSATDQVEGILSSNVSSNPEGNNAIKVTNFGAGYDRYAQSNVSMDFMFDGKDVFKQAVQTMVKASLECLQELELSIEQIDLFIAHQANARIISTVGKQLQLSESQIFTNIHRYGNTSAASVPIALCEAFQANRIKPMAKMLFAAFGAGYSSGAAFIKAPQRCEPVQNPSSEILQQEDNALDILRSAITRDQADCK